MVYSNNDLDVSPLEKHSLENTFNKVTCSTQMTKLDTSFLQKMTSNFKKILILAKNLNQNQIVISNSQKF